MEKDSRKRIRMYIGDGGGRCPSLEPEMTELLASRATVSAKGRLCREVYSKGELALAVSIFFS